MKKLLLVLSLIMFSLLVFSCKDDATSPIVDGDEGSKTPNQYGVVVKGNSRMLTTSEAASIISITSNSVVFSRDFGFEVGDVFTTPPIPGEPRGTIRKITGIKTAKVSGGIVFETISASLEELADEGRINLQGTAMNLSPKKYKKEILSGVNVEASFGAKTDLIGYIDFSNSIEASLKFKFRGDLDFGLNLSARTQFSKETTFFDQDLGTVVLSGVSITPNVRLFVRTEGQASADVNFGTLAEFKYDGEILYKNKWSFQQSSGKSFTLKPTEIKGEAGAKLIIGGEISFFIYDLFGPVFRDEGYLKLVASLSNNPQWRISYGMDLKAGVGPSWLLEGFTSYRELWDKNLFDIEIASGSFGGGETNQPPEILNIYSDPETIIAEQQAKLIVDVADEDYNSVQSRWDIENNGWDSGFSTLKNYYYTFLSSGDYQVKVECKDKEGKTDTYTKTFTVVSSGEINPHFVSFIPEWGETNVQKDRPFSWTFSNPELVLYYDFVYSVNGIPSGTYLFTTNTNSFDPFQQGSFGLDENTHYYWRVRANLNDGSQVESEMLNFTTGDFDGGGGEEKTLVLQPGPEGEDVDIFRTENKTTGEVYTGSYPDDPFLEPLRLEDNFDIFNPDHVIMIERETYIQFEGVDQIPPGSKIISAKLKTYFTGFTPSIAFDFSRVNSPWEEQTISWDTRPTSTLLFQYQLEGDVFQGFVGINVKHEVERWLSGEKNYGFKFSISPGKEGQILIKSSDNSDISHRPSLEIVYTE